MRVEVRPYGMSAEARRAMILLGASNEREVKEHVRNLREVGRDERVILVSKLAGVWLDLYAAALAPKGRRRFK